MGIDIALIRIMIFAFPGIVCYQLFSLINGSSENRKDWEGILSIFVFSVFSYSILDLCVQLLPTKSLEFFGLVDCTFNELLGELNTTTSIQFKYQPMIALTVIAIILVYIATFIRNKKVFNHLAKYLKLTKKIGSEDIWAVFHDTYQEWVVVRDFRNKLIYYGYVSFFSDSSKKHELILTEVSVYSESSELMYTTDVLFFIT